jgi:alcohol dehydrogenase
MELYGSGLSDKKIVTTLCPGGKERMARLLRLVDAYRIDLTPLLTHTFPLDRIAEAYDLFAQRKDSVLKIAIKVD